MRRPNRLALIVAVVAALAVAPGPTARDAAMVPASAPQALSVGPKTDGGASPVLLVLRAPGDAAADVAGFDPGGPRDLTVWARSARDERPIAAAHARSRPDGRFVARGLLLPLEAELVALPSGSEPTAAAWRSATSSPGPAPAAPDVWIEDDALRVALGPYPRPLRLADARGREIDPVRVPRGLRPGAVWQRSFADLPGRPAWVSPDDGERPRWQRIPRRFGAGPPGRDPDPEPSDRLEHPGHARTLEDNR